MPDRELTAWLPVLADLLDTKGNLAILDPSAGNGDAAFALADLLERHERTRVQLYGVEPDRAAANAERPWADFISTEPAHDVVYPRKQFDLLCYHADAGPQVGFCREEDHLKQFLQTLRVLRDEGLAIIMLQRQALLRAAVPLLRALDGFAGKAPDLVALAPDPGLTDWILVLGRQRKKLRGVLSAEALERWTQMVNALTWPVLGQSYTNVWTLNGTERRKTLPPLRTVTFDPEVAAEIAAVQGWIATPTYTEKFWAPREQQLQPARPLRPGHLALAVAGGLYNRQLLDMRPEGFSVYLLTGISSKRLKVRNEELPDGTMMSVAREEPVTEVRVFDVLAGTFTRLTVDAKRKEPPDDD